MGSITPFFNWSFSHTISPPVTLRLTYQPESTTSNPKPSEKTVDLVSTDESTTLSTYEAFTYETDTTNDEGQPQTQTTDVLTKKEEIKRTTQASVAQNYVVDRLSRGAGLPPGDAITKTVTTYKYLATTDGPFLHSETTETYITMAELAGGLDIPTYKYYDPGVALFLSTVREVAYQKKVEWSNTTQRNSDLGVENTYSYKRESTKTETSTWIANGLRDFGKQGFAEAMKQLESIAFDPARSNELIGTMVEYMTELIFEGTEIQVEIGKGEYGFESRRDEPEIDRELEPDPNDPGNYDPDDPYDPIDPPINDNPRSLRNNAVTSSGKTGKKCFKGIIQFQDVQYNSADSTQTANYEMPFAPDDYLFLNGNKRKLVRNNARLAAEEYAITESLMDIGHAFGQNIVTAFGDIPTLELSPVYVRLADVEGAFLLDALSYAWDSNGLVVSSDLMLVGVTGYYGSTPPATSWLRLPVSSLGLPAAGNPIIGTGSKANSIAIPTGFNPLNLTPVLAALPSNGVDTYAVKHNTATIIGPVLKREQYVIGIRIGTATVDYSYALFLFEEYVTQVRVGVTFSESYLILVPSVNGYSITASPPIFTTGTAIAVPTKAIAASQLVPRFEVSSLVAVPATVVQVAAFAPDGVGDASRIINVPAAAAQVAVFAPEKVGDISRIVNVPAAAIQLAALTPETVGDVSVTITVPLATVQVAAQTPLAVGIAYPIMQVPFSFVAVAPRLPFLNIGGAAGSMATRGQVTTTLSIQANQTLTGFITLPRSCVIIDITTNQACWFRLYSNALAAAADVSRIRTASPALAAGVIADPVLPGAVTLNFEPAPVALNRETVSSVSSSYPYRITNDAGTGEVIITVTYLTLEA